MTLEGDKVELWSLLIKSGAKIVERKNRNIPVQIQVTGQVISASGYSKKDLRFNYSRLQR
jgi:hypothetical protein